MEDLQYRKSWRKWFVMRIMEPYTLRNAHASFCVSAYGAAKPVFRRYANENLGHINNAIEVRPVEKPDPALRREFGFSETDVVALCTSRISTEKGILYLQQAMLHLEQQGKRMPKLLLVGDGPHTALVKESMKALIERGQVVMPGRRDDVYRLLAISDFFVLPTLHEHQSQSLLEAMVQAKPIVTTRVGGNPELVVHGKTGLLVPAASASGLAEGMETMVEDAQMRRCMGQAGRERVLTEFSMDVLVQHMDALYTRMLTRK
jgi:glycosyltransferase involved in cell wall biosynthesis